MRATSRTSPCMTHTGLNLGACSLHDQQTKGTYAAVRTLSRGIMKESNLSICFSTSAATATLLLRPSLPTWQVLIPQHKLPRLGQTTRLAVL